MKFRCDEMKQNSVLCNYQNQYKISKRSEFELNYRMKQFKELTNAYLH